MIDIEVFSYTIQTSILGMLIVFGFLWFLSLLMGLLVKIFEDKKVLSEVSDEIESPAEMENWLFAAAAAFLSEEELECSVSAVSWRPAIDEKNNPWLQSPKLPGKWSGV